MDFCCCCHCFAGLSLSQQVDWLTGPCFSLPLHTEPCSHFPYGLWRLNSGPHACAVSTSPAALSPQFWHQACSPHRITVVRSGCKLRTNLSYGYLTVTGGSQGQGTEEHEMKSGRLPGSGSVQTRLQRQKMPLYVDSGQRSPKPRGEFQGGGGGTAIVWVWDGTQASMWPGHQNLCCCWAEDTQQEAMETEWTGEEPLLTVGPGWVVWSSWSVRRRAGWEFRSLQQS